VTRPPVDERRIHELARVAHSPVRIYLTGGSTAVLEGWRDSTIDVDLRFGPESDELMRALPALQDRLGINIELASPPDFIPELLRLRLRRRGKLGVRSRNEAVSLILDPERGLGMGILGLGGEPVEPTLLWRDQVRQSAVARLRRRRAALGKRAARTRESPP
jgi:hypothetical protein